MVHPNGSIVHREDALCMPAFHQEPRVLQRHNRWQFHMRVDLVEYVIEASSVQANVTLTPPN